MTAKKSFDPNAIAIHNKQFLGLDYSLAESELVVMSLPWDVTTSYGDGTSRGPKAIIEASYQLDLISPYLKKAWETKIFTNPIPKYWKKENQKLRKLAKQYIRFLEKGGRLEQHKQYKKVLHTINQGCAAFHQWVEEEVTKVIHNGKKVLVVGGDHSVSYGAIKALSEKQAFSILHIDAHADLRKAYEGFYHSHASIMHDILPLHNVEKIIQVGIRDYCPEEQMIISEHSKLKTFFDSNLKQKYFQGITWQEQCKQIVDQLTDNVYISFDIDGLDAKFCPHTGTPVPGGLDINEVFFLFNEVLASGRNIIAADLVEVTPGKDQWDANVGARVLFQLCCFLKKSASK